MQQLPRCQQDGAGRTLTLRQELGGCSVMTIWRLRREGKLPKPRKLGSRNVTPKEEADEAIAKLIGLSTELPVPAPKQPTAAIGKTGA